MFRVWDVFFVEGHDVSPTVPVWPSPLPAPADPNPQTLFRIAIAILKMHETEICACESVGDLFTLMSTMTSRLWAADKLIAVSLGLRHEDGEESELIYASFNMRTSLFLNMGISGRGAREG